MKNFLFKFERVHLLSLIYMSYRKSPTLVPSKLCLCLPTEWPLLPFRSEEHCRITDSLHITRFCELSSDLDPHRIQFLESHYTNDRSFAGNRGVWLCVCKTVAPPPHTMFFFPEGFRVKIFIFSLVCVWWKWNWKWCLVMLPISWIFSKRESFKFTVHLVKLLWDFGLGRSCVQLFDGTWLRDLLLDLSSGLESTPAPPPHYHVPSCVFSLEFLAFLQLVLLFTTIKLLCFNQKGKKKSIIENEWIVAEAKETLKEVL